MRSEVILFATLLSLIFVWLLYDLRKKNLSISFENVTLENAHDYLQKYCVAEVIFLAFLGVIFVWQLNFLFDNIFRMNEWQCAALAPFAMATWGSIKETFNSINSSYGDS